MYLFNKYFKRLSVFLKTTCIYSLMIIIITNNDNNSNRYDYYLFSSVRFICSVMYNFLQCHGLEHTRLPCPSPIPRACSNSYPLSWWCHPTIPSSVDPFSSCLQSFPALESFPVSWFIKSCGQSSSALSFLYDPALTFIHDYWKNHSFD